MKNKKKTKIVAEIKDAIDLHVPKNKNKLIKLQDFVQEMSDKGLIKKREYGIPLVDTIGRTIFQNKTN